MGEGTFALEEMESAQSLRSQWLQRPGLGRCWGTLGALLPGAWQRTWACRCLLSPQPQLCPVRLAQGPGLGPVPLPLQAYSCPFCDNLL